MALTEQYRVWLENNFDVHTNPAFTETRKRAHGARLKKLTKHFHGKWSKHFDDMVDHMCRHDDNENENGPKWISKQHARRVDEIGKEVDNNMDKKESLQGYQMAHENGKTTDKDIEHIRTLHRSVFGSDDL